MVKAHPNMLRVLIGMTGLFVGFTTYITVRPPFQPPFIAKYVPNIQLFDPVPNALLIIGYNLPAFIHPFSFILLTAGILFANTHISYICISLSWCLVNIFFEFGQTSPDRLLTLLPYSIRNILFTETTRSFFANGTFDLWDLVAIFLGSCFAYFVLYQTSFEEGRQ